MGIEDIFTTGDQEKAPVTAAQQAWRKKARRWVQNRGVEKETATGDAAELLRKKRRLACQLGLTIDGTLPKVDRCDGTPYIMVKQEQTATVKPSCNAFRRSRALLCCRDEGTVEVSKRTSEVPFSALRGLVKACKEGSLKEDDSPIWTTKTLSQHLEAGVRIS